MIKIKDIKRKTTHVPLVPWAEGDREGWRGYVNMLNLRAVKRGDHHSPYATEGDATAVIKMVDGSVIGHPNMQERTVFIFGLEAWQRIAWSLCRAAHDLKLDDFLDDFIHHPPKRAEKKATLAMTQLRAELISRGDAIVREVDYQLSKEEDQL